MRRYDGIDSVPPRATAPAVTTLGVFDGMHRGHRSVLDEVVGWARDIDGSPWMITFETHPDLLLTGRAPDAITTLDQRLRQIERAGVEHCWVLPFDEALRAVTAERFIEELLVERLGVAGVVLGEGARFGKGGRGSFELLRELGPAHGFDVRSVPPFLHEGAPVSSTRVRAAVRDGDLGLACDMLGRPFSVAGRVVPGDGRGSRIGVPTANLGGPFSLLPPPGVYLTQAIFGDTARFSVTNIGYRPTFADETSPGLTVETHVFDLEEDLAGAPMRVRLLEKIRDERKFASADALVARIHEDLDEARARQGKWNWLSENDLTVQKGDL